MGRLIHMILLGVSAQYLLSEARIAARKSLPECQRKAAEAATRRQRVSIMPRTPEGSGWPAHQYAALQAESEDEAALAR